MVRSLAGDRSPSPLLLGYVEALVMVAASTLAGLLVAPRWGNAAVDLLYLPAVLAAAVFAGLGPALVAAIASALAYNFYFTAPRHTLRIAEPNDLVTVIVLFVVAVVASHLAAAIRREARLARRHAARNATIAGLARRLLSCTSAPDIARVASGELAEIFECNAMLIENNGDLKPIGGVAGAMSLAPSDAAAAALALTSGERTGRGLKRAVPTEWQFHPVKVGSKVLAVMGVARDDGTPPVLPDRTQLLDSLLDQVALALDRVRLEGETREFARLRERDHVRSTLVATIGEDLKPVLETLGGATRALRRGGSGDREMVSLIGSEVAKLDRYLANLADLGLDSEREPIRAGSVSIDLFQRSVTRDGSDVHLTPKEFAVLAELARHPGRVLTHAQLLRTAWGPAQEAQTDYLRVAIRGLRQKLERNPSVPEIILNEPAIGYRLSVTANA